MELGDDATYMKPCTKTWDQCEKVDQYCERRKFIRIIFHAIMRSDCLKGYFMRRICNTLRYIATEHQHADYVGQALWSS